MLTIPSAYKNREQTWVKHEILKTYLEKLFMIRGQFDKQISYIDCFAGPWQESGTDLSDTSIAISLGIMKKCQKALEAIGRHTEFSALYIEKDGKAFSKLNEFLNASKSNGINTTALHGNFFDLRNDIMNWCNNDHFAFFFIDPTGWKNVVEIATLKPLLKRQKSEYLINFMFDYILRTHTQETFENDMRNIFGFVPNTEGMNSSKREDHLVRTYRDSLKKASYNSPKKLRTACVRVMYPTRDRTFFDLIYLTRHPLGIVKFIEASEAVEIIQQKLRKKTKQERRIEKTKQFELFDDTSISDNAVSSDLSEIKEYWLTKLSYAPKLFGIEQLADMLEETDWFVSYLQEAFKELLEEKRVKNLDSPRIRPKNVVHFEANNNVGEQLMRVRT